MNVMWPDFKFITTNISSVLTLRDCIFSCYLLSESLKRKKIMIMMICDYNQMMHDAFCLVPSYHQGNTLGSCGPMLHFLLGFFYWGQTHHFCVVALRHVVEDLVEIWIHNKNLHKIVKRWLYNGHLNLYAVLILTCL